MDISKSSVEGRSPAPAASSNSILLWSVGSGVALGVTSRYISRQELWLGLPGNLVLSFLLFFCAASAFHVGVHKAQRSGGKVGWYLFEVALSTLFGGAMLDMLL